jgi:PASTA domain
MPGQHTITVCRDCGDVDSEWKQSASFTVLAVVPDLGTLHLPEAQDRLGQTTLVLGSVQGPADDPAARVVGQDPPAGTAVDSRSVVNVTVAVPPLVRVPDLLGRTRAEADSLLTSYRLVLRVRSGSGRVATQDPPAGSQVPPGSAVTVTLEPVQPVLVRVPDLLGRTRAKAEAAVGAVGLVLQPRGAPIGTVKTQTPPPGTRVPRGSTVSVGIGWPWWWLGTIAVVLALIALVTWTLWRHIRPRSLEWVHQHVRVISGAAVSDTGASELGEIGPEPSRAVGLEPHPDRGSQMSEEAHR